MMPDIERSEYPDGFFECNALRGILSWIPSAPLLRVDWPGPGGLRGLSHAVDSRHRSLFLDCYHRNPWLLLVGAVILILHFAWPPLPQQRSFISLFSSHVELIALLRNTHLKGHHVPHVCFYPFLCAQGRLSAACHLPWWEQRDGQRAY